MKRKSIILLSVSIIIMVIFFLNKVTYSIPTDKIHFIKNYPSSLDGANSILVESGGKYILVDAFRASSTGAASNGAVVANYLSGVLTNQKKLDYIIITHAHTDHVGGFADITDYVNSDTIVFYKDIGYSENNGEYVCTTGCASDTSLDYLVNSVNSLKNANAVMCALSGTITSNFWEKLSNECKNKLAEKDSGYNMSAGDVTNTNIDDTLKFTIGNNLTVNLYNLYHISDDKENQNSIVTLLTTNGGKKILLTGDIQANPLVSGSLGFENEIANLIYGVINKNSSTNTYIDILKAAHHGESTSNSYYMLKKLKPKYTVVLKTESIFQQESLIKFGAAIGFLKQQGGEVYSTRNSSGAVVAEIEGTNIKMLNYNSTGTPTNYNENGITTTNNEALEISEYMNDGWYVFQNESRGKSWNDYLDQYGSNDNIKPDEYLKVYLNNGIAVTGWQKINDNWYYFCKVQNEVGTCREGAMVTGNGINKVTINGINDYIFDSVGKLTNLDDTVIFKDNLIVDNNNLGKVNIGNKASNLKNSIISNGTLTIKNALDQSIGDNELLCSGYKVNIDLNSKTLNYTLLVKGDLLGTGLIDKTGISMAAKYLLNSNQSQSNIYYLASDYNDDSKVKINDIMLMLRDME